VPALKNPSNVTSHNSGTFISEVRRPGTGTGILQPRRITPRHLATRTCGCWPASSEGRFLRPRTRAAIARRRSSPRSGSGRPCSQGRARAAARTTRPHPDDTTAPGDRETPSAVRDLMGHPADRPSTRRWRCWPAPSCGSAAISAARKRDSLMRWPARPGQHGAGGTQTGRDAAGGSLPWRSRPAIPG
jgi:hypothetical protein